MTRPPFSSTERAPICLPTDGTALRIDPNSADSPPSVSYSRNRSHVLPDRGYDAKKQSYALRPLWRNHTRGRRATLLRKRARLRACDWVCSCIASRLPLSLTVERVRLGETGKVDVARV